ncbi:hypothetical protein SLEP1_g30225 [Rubroshorea leprosula]|uniref:Uncharacterized protein n=1 Tax=Rubroshorea leprosula TaxID=152421 RepID=A0AAV5KA00_9ROSI|nr:hypothetical protein SLEP1_g30225 [Rubroshorea leprosula]
MDISNSQCGSGSESGWTPYLDQSSFSRSRWKDFSGVSGEDYGGIGARFEHVGEDEEDLSMVSDASSGPRHYCEDDEDCNEENRYVFPAPSASESAKKSKNKKKIRENQQHCSLDDTASSPTLSLSKKNLKKEASMDVFDFSQDCSATQNKGKSGLRKKLGFLQSSFAGKPASGEAGGFQGRK